MMTIYLLNCLCVSPTSDHCPYKFLVTWVLALKGKFQDRIFSISILSLFAWNQSVAVAKYILFLWFRYILASLVRYWIHYIKSFSQKQQCYFNIFVAVKSFYYYQISNLCYCCYGWFSFQVIFDKTERIDMSIELLSLFLSPFL